MSDIVEQERIARQTKDEAGIKEVFTKMLASCQDEDEVNSLMKTLGRRKDQLKPAFKWLIKRVFDARQQEFAENCEDSSIADRFVEFCHVLLHDVVEGKMFLEEERITVSTVLKNIYLTRNQPKKALDTVFGVPVETFTSIEEADVVAFQLEQLRLAIVSKDWVRADISSKRIRKKYFAEKKDREQEAKYDEYMVSLHMGQKNYTEASRTLLKASTNVDAEKNVILSSFVAAISPKGDERDELMRTLITNKSNAEPVRRVLALFLKDELIQYEAMDVFKKPSGLDFNGYWDDVVESVDSHNLCVVAKFCTIISIKDLASLLQCRADEVIDKVCRVVNDGTLKCKIDQDRQLIRFHRSLEHDWMRDVDSVLESIMEANHMIHNENLKQSGYTKE